MAVDSKPVAGSACDDVGGEVVDDEVEEMLPSVDVLLDRVLGPSGALSGLWLLARAMVL